MQEDNEKLRKRLVKKQRAEASAFKQQFSKYMIGKSDLFCPMNILGEFIKYTSEAIERNPNVKKIKLLRTYQK
jgi:hypothetical protein